MAERGSMLPKNQGSTSVPSKRRVVKHLVKSATVPVVLTIAGFDPSSGAGMTADLQVFQDHDFEGVAAVTALTVQPPMGVSRIEPVSAMLLRETLNSLVGGGGMVAGVKIGMLATAELVGVVAEFLRVAGIGRERVVLDPVIRASAGAELLEPEGVRRVVEELLPLVGWVTPNVEEAGALVGEGVVGRERVAEVARRIQELGGWPPPRRPRFAARDQASGSMEAVKRSRRGTSSRLNVVVTGGHLEPPHDFLRTAGGAEVWIPGERVEARSRHGTHGTGCVFSSALLCRLLLGDGPAEAVRGAKAAVVRRLENRDRGKNRKTKGSLQR
jgi:hydroxymethylpyrimidine/phosphomethylpyrimidine kinase